MKFVHSTRGQLAKAIRERYASATGLEALKIATWVSANLTKAEIQAAFGITAGQATSLLARLNAKATQLQSVLTAVGE